MKCNCRLVRTVRIGVWKLELSITSSLDQSETGGGRDTSWIRGWFCVNFFLFQVTFRVSQLLIIHFYTPLLEGPPPGKKQLTF